MRRDSALLVVVSCTLAIAIGLGCGGPRSPSGPAVANDSLAPTSNVLRRDYVGSAVCARCHPGIAESFTAAPMHRMTRLADTAEIHAPFDGTTFHFKDDSATMTSDGGARFVALDSKFGDHVYRVTKVIGGHHREDFAGVEVEAAKKDAKTLGDPRDELILPVSWVFATKAYRYKGYSVMLKERPGLKAGGVWNETCIFCHNTVPYFSAIAGTLEGPGAIGYQGEVVDRLLPEARRWSFAITDDERLHDAAEEEILFLSKGSGKVAAGGAAALDQLVRTTRAKFDAEDLVEVGIGCESCHLGGAEHAKSPRAVHPSLTPRGEFVETKSGTLDGHALDEKALAAQTIDRACARCHQVLFSGYPYTWEASLRAKSPGGSSINSGEARDFLLGACTGAMSCVDCHDPHAADGRAEMDALEATGAREVCTKCHTRFSDSASLEAHTHHAANGEGSRCLGCHMPKKNMSLDLGLTRYHRVGSPNEKVKVEGDRPLECALCHADKSVESLVTKMESWWGRSFDRDALRRLYGDDLSVNAILATLERGKAHEQGTAMGVLRSSPNRKALPALAKGLVHEIPILRYYAASALEAIAKETVPFDLHRDDALIEADATAWLAKLGAPK